MSYCISFDNRRTIGLIIGWISAAISLFLSTFYIVVLFTTDIITGYFVKEQPDLQLSFPSISFAIMLVTTYLLPISLLGTIASVLLIVGIFRHSHLAVVPWLVHNAFLLLLGFFTLAGCVLSIPTTPIVNDHQTKLTWFSICGFILWSLYGWAWIFVVRIFRHIRSTSDFKLLSNNQADDTKLGNNAKPIAVQRY